tara:strand:- start:693 stop:1376 length:684 start_codon:yes stop_codon:yes gene_type:complete
MQQTFEDFLAVSNPNIPFLEFAINLILTAILSILLRYLYIKCGLSLSNRGFFSQIFVLLSMTTMLMITIVKSSLALSLGLVGALSIIRFRAAIKEPEELAYLFLAIAIGLGFGANQVFITIGSFIIISAIIIITKQLYSSNFNNNSNLHLIIRSNSTKNINVNDVLKILSEHCDKIDLRRLDENKEQIEISLLVEFESIENVNIIKTELQKLDKEVQLTFMDNMGLS